MRGVFCSVVLVGCGLDTSTTSKLLTCGPGTHEEDHMCLPDEVEEAATDTASIDEAPEEQDTSAPMDSGHIDEPAPSVEDTGGSSGNTSGEPGSWSAGKIRFRTSPPGPSLGGLIILAAPADDPDWPVGTSCVLTTPELDEVSGEVVAWGIPMAFICPTPEDEPSLSVPGGDYSLRASLYPSDDSMPMYCAGATITVDGDVEWEFELEPC